MIFVLTWFIDPGGDDYRSVRYHMCQVTLPECMPHIVSKKKKREREKKGGRSERREGEGEGAWMERWRIREHRRVNQHNLDSRE